MKIELGTHDTNRGRIPFHVDFSRQQFRHGLLLGKSGTGKSTFLRNIIAEALNAGIGVCVVDPHGDLINDCIPYIPERRLSQFNLIDPTERRAVDIGLFDYPDIERAIDAFMHIMEKHAGPTGWGPATAHIYRNLLDAALELSSDPALIEVKKLLTYRDYADQFLQRSKNPSVWAFHQQYFREFKDIERVRDFSHPLNKHEELMRTGIREFLCQKKSLSALHIMDNQQILFVRVPKGPMGARKARILGSFIVNKLNLDSFRRKNRNKQFLVVIDEFHNFVKGLDVQAMFAEGRKYGVQYLVASQSLAQLRDKDIDYDEIILGNVSHVFAFRTSGKDAQQIGIELGSDVLGTQLTRMSNYHFAALTTDNDDANLFHDVKNSRYPSLYKSSLPARKIMAWARENLGTPKEEVNRYIDGILAQGAPRPALS